MEKGKIKKLTNPEIEKHLKKLDETKSMVVKTQYKGKEQVYEIDYDVIFKKTKQHDLMQDFIDFFALGAEKPELFKHISGYTSLLIIKHFTDMDIPDGIDEALVYLLGFIDMGILGQIINQLPEEQLIEVYELLAKTAKEIGDNVDNSTKEIEDEIENVIKEIDNNKSEELDSDKEEETK